VKSIFKPSPQTPEQYVISHQRGYNFINPLLDFEQPYKEMPRLEAKIKDYIFKAQKDGKAKNISIYFRQLNTGKTISFNDRLKFSPASLLKVPLMIASLKQAEIDPNFLYLPVTFDIPPDEQTVPNFRFGEPIEFGQTYTVEELIARLIINSDNNAGLLLLQVVDGGVLDRVYSDLEIVLPNLPGVENYMTVKEYSKFIRILFNSTYLTREMSESALYIMSLSHFDGGIVRGVGPDVTVAHKFGERDIDGVKQLHDCGIMYFENNPSLICIMTRGGKFDDLETVIADVTKIVADHINKN